MKPTKTQDKRRMSNFEKELYHQLWKKRKAIKDLQIRNLLKTNIALLKNLDISGSVLF